MSWIGDKYHLRVGQTRLCQFFSSAVFINFDFRSSELMVVQHPSMIYDCDAQNVMRFVLICYFRLF